MRRRGRRRVAAAALLLASITAGSLAVALTASNTVAPSNLLSEADDPSWNTLAPPQCASLGLTAMVQGNGNINGNNTNQLILGGPAGQNIKGGGGKDCLLGGGGNDTLNGGAGVDVCIGGPGTDTFNPSCETQIQ